MAELLIPSSSHSSDIFCTTLTLIFGNAFPSIEYLLCKGFIDGAVSTCFMNREEALSLIKENVKNVNMIKHMLSVETIMKHLAEHLGEDPHFWGLTGLLHDIDYEIVKGDMETHGLLAEELLATKVDEKIIRALKAHNQANTGFEPLSKMEKMLVSADAVSGLIIACALVMPSKKLSEVKLQTIVKKFKDKDFARGSDRNRIAFCESMGLEKEKLFEISLKALWGIHEELGL
jgi:putative nucleotidyltransferase with HDIG domain